MNIKMRLIKLLFAVLFFGLFYLPLSAVALAEYRFVGPLRNSIPHQSKGYEYAPSIIYWQGKYRMYYCSKASNYKEGVPFYEGRSWDSVRYAESTDGINWEKKGEVLRSANNRYSVSVCDPAVTIFKGRIYLYYGDCPGAENNYDNSCLEAPIGLNLTRIAVARSVGSYLDDSSWEGPFEKYTQDNQWIEYSFSTNQPNGSHGEDYPKMIVDPDCVQGGVNRCGDYPYDGRYGQGQPTVVNREGKIYMWWHDDTDFDPPLEWRPKLKFALSEDGVNFSSPVTVDLPGDTWQPEGVGPYVFWDPYRQEFVNMTLNRQHTDLAYVFYHTSADGLNWSDYSTLIDSNSIPNGSNNMGLSLGIKGSLIPDHFLLGFNNNTSVYNGRLVVGDIEVQLPEMGTMTIPGDLDYNESKVYQAGGWSLSNNMIASNNNSIKIGLKKGVSYQAGEMRGFLFEAPAGKRFTKVSFNWVTNYDGRYFYAALDVPYHHALWLNNQLGGNSGRAEVWLPEGGFIGFGLFTRKNFTYPYDDNDWFFEVTSLEIKSLGSFCLSCPFDKPAKSLGNANCDDRVDLGDFSLWLSVYKKILDGQPVSETEKGAVDFNCQEGDSSHEVDLSDFSLWLEEYRKSLE